MLPDVFLLTTTAKILYLINKEHQPNRKFTPLPTLFDLVAYLFQLGCLSFSIGLPTQNTPERVFSIFTHRKDYHVNYFHYIC